MRQEKRTLLVDDERGQIALEATWEISAIATLIGVAVDHLDECDLIAIKIADAPVKVPEQSNYKRRW